jgi:hypothetical protein
MFYLARPVHPLCGDYQVCAAGTIVLTCDARGNRQTEFSRFSLSLQTDFED